MVVREGVRLRAVVVRVVRLVRVVRPRAVTGEGGLIRAVVREAVRIRSGYVVRLGALAGYTVRIRAVVREGGLIRAVVREAL
ncbi:hypothetical protein SVIOM74S_02264 [Streptomyces violarus]